MARNGIRDTAYVLHMLSALGWSVIPFLGWLQSAGLASHGSVPAPGMILVLGVGLPALIMTPMALVMSFCVRPPDHALWLLSGLLLITCAALILEFPEGVIVGLLGVYVVAGLGFGIRWMVKAGAWPART